MKFAVAPQPPFDTGYQIIMVWHIAIFSTWHRWKPQTSSTGEQTKREVTPERKERPLVFRQINFEFLPKSRMLLFWLPGTLHGVPLLQKPVPGRLFTMQTFVHNGGEKLAEGECGKQTNVISVPQGIFSGVMPLVNVNCLSGRHAICGSFHQPVATSLHYRGDELIKKKKRERLVFSQKEILSSVTCQTWAWHFLKLFRIPFVMTWVKKEIINKFMKWCRILHLPSPPAASSSILFVQRSNRAPVFPSWDQFLLVHYRAGWWKPGNHDGSEG